jgi:NTE family protein
MGERLRNWLAAGGLWRRRAPRLSLALQGGGAHGAFTWGVLDRLLEDDRFAFDGLSGTSAGALNAAVMLSGWIAGGNDGARASLARFWRRVADLTVLDPGRGSMQRWLEQFLPGWSNPFSSMEALTRVMSPAQFNPFDLNPLRNILAEQVNVEAIRACAGAKLFVGATNVRSGRLRLFTNADLSIDALLASSCLPTLQRAVRVGDESFWDGGYSGNPPLAPLVEHCRARDVLLVQLNPVEMEDEPTSAQDILHRVNQIVFNAPLMSELDGLDMARRVAREGFSIGGRMRRRVRRLRLHRIDATAEIGALAAGSMLRPEWPMLERLRDQGRAAVDRWLNP